MAKRLKNSAFICGNPVGCVCSTPGIESRVASDRNVFNSVIRSEYAFDCTAYQLGLHTTTFLISLLCEAHKIPCAKSTVRFCHLTFYSLLVTLCTNSLTFNNCTFCPHSIYVFCIYLRTNSDLCHLQHKLIGFYNRDEVFTAP